MHCKFFLTENNPTNVNARRKSYAFLSNYTHNVQAITCFYLWLLKRFRRFLLRLSCWPCRDTSRSRRPWPLWWWESRPLGWLGRSTWPAFGSRWTSWTCTIWRTKIIWLIVWNQVDVDYKATRLFNGKGQIVSFTTVLNHKNTPFKTMLNWLTNE